MGQGGGGGGGVWGEEDEIRMVVEGKLRRGFCGQVNEEDMCDIFEIGKWMLDMLSRILTMVICNPA